MATLVGIASLAVLAATEGGPAAANPTRVPARHPHPRVARIVVHGPARARVSRTLFGANLLWPAGGGGAYNTSTGHFYPSFVAMTRRLGISALRYPGGTTADSFQWERAVGVAAHRRVNEPFGIQARRFVPDRTVVDGPVPSSLGPAEFGRLLDKTGAVGNVVVNFATGTVGEAAAFVDYLDGAAPTTPPSKPSEPGYWAGLRASEGHPAPYRVTYFEVGNEQQVAAEQAWRAGRLVALGPHDVPCPPGERATCLYVFGGTTRFVRQRVGTFANELPSAARSTGRPNQRFFAYYPPVVPGSEQVEVAGRRWRPVASLKAVGRRAHAYTFTPSDGAIVFGDGVHGAIPPPGARVTVTYDSGPHAGFVEFYAAMKKVDPHARVCASEGTSRAFLALMGRRHPYDCLEFHAYATERNTRLPLGIYERDLMAFPVKEGRTLASLEQAAARAAGHAVPVVVTEYGQPVAPMPVADRHFLLSLDEGLLVAAQLRQWILHDVPLAEKYLLVSTPLARPSGPAALARARAGRHAGNALRRLGGARQPGLSVESAMIARTAGRFIAEPSGLVLGLMHQLAGGRLLTTSVHDGPRLRPPGTPALLPLATSTSSGVDVLVVNTNLHRAARATIAFDGVDHGGHVVASVLDGPRATAYNTAAQPRVVRTRTSSASVGTGTVAWRFPPHSVTLLRFR